MFWIEACKRSFPQRCRHLVSLDGCFMKGNYDGQMLMTIAIDVNDYIYLIVYVIVEKEDTMM